MKTQQSGAAEKFRQMPAGCTYDLLQKFAQMDGVLCKERK